MKSRPFEEFFEIPLRNGLTKPKQVRGKGYKMVNMGELFAYPRILNIVMDRVPLTDKEKQTSMLEDDDLIFARQSLVREGAGQCSIFFGDKEEVCFESHLIRCRLNKRVANPLFYYYFFLSWAGKVAIDAIIEQGAGASGIRGKDLARVPVPDVEKNTQDRIAKQLDNIDRKIELNCQTNQTLEQIAQAIFKSWFVDFEPVKAKQHIRALGGNFDQTERVAQAVIAGAVNLDVITTATDLSALDQQLTQALSEKLAHQTAEQREQLATTAGHFPDQLVESELGLIPEGWEVSTIEALFELNPKRTLKKGQLAPYLEMKNMPTQGHLASEWTDREMGSGTRFMNGDALMARITPCLENGKTAFVDFLDDGVIGWGSTEYIVIRSKEPLPLAMAYLLARDKEFRSFAIQNMTGTSGRQRVNAKSLVDYRVVHSNVPGLYAQFGLQLEKIMAAIKINGDESRYLSRLRDLLLPKLLSGELTINGTPNKPERRTT